MTGPTAMPACTPIETMLLAHERSFSDSTRFGIAARDAEKNGSSAIADPNARAIRTPGSFAKTIAAKKTGRDRLGPDHHGPAVVSVSERPREGTDQAGDAEREQERQRLHERRVGSLPHGVVEGRVRGGSTGDGDESSDGETTNVGLR